MVLDTIRGVAMEDGETWSDSGYIYKADVLGIRYAIERHKDEPRKNLRILARAPGKVLPSRMAQAVGRAGLWRWG